MEPTPNDVRLVIKSLNFHKEKLKNDGPWSKSRPKSHSENRVKQLEKYLEKWGHLAKEWRGKGKNMPPDAYKPEERTYLKLKHSVTPKGKLTANWNKVKGKDLDKDK